MEDGVFQGGQGGPQSAEDVCMSECVSPCHAKPHILAEQNEVSETRPYVDKVRKGASASTPYMCGKG